MDKIVTILVFSVLAFLMILTAIAARPDCGQERLALYDPWTVRWVCVVGEVPVMRLRERGGPSEWDNL